MASRGPKDKDLSDALAPRETFPFDRRFDARLARQGFVALRDVHVSPWMERQQALGIGLAVYARERQGPLPALELRLDVREAAATIHIWSRPRQARYDLRHDAAHEDVPAVVDAYLRRHLGPLQ